MAASWNQIVVCQPNATVRLDVRLENETVWLSQLKKELIVIDAYPGVATLDMLAKRGRGVKIELVTHSNGELEESDFEAFGAQCGKFTKTICGICHDRFIIVDQKEIFWTGASLKDAGRLTFAARMLAHPSGSASPNLPSEMLRISSAHFENGCGGHFGSSCYYPQGDVGTAVVRQGEEIDACIWQKGEGVIYYAHDKIEKRESRCEDRICVLCAGPRRIRSGAAVRTQDG